MLTHVKKSVLLGLATIALLVGFASLNQTNTLTTEQGQPTLMAEGDYQSGGG